MKNLCKHHPYKNIEPESSLMCNNWRGFLHCVLTTDHCFEVKNCLQAERCIRWIHVQIIFIICGFHICEFTYSLKFIYNSKINTLCFVVIHGHEQSSEKFELLDVCSQLMSNKVILCLLILVKQCFVSFCNLFSAFFFCIFALICW